MEFGVSGKLSSGQIICYALRMNLLTILRESNPTQASLWFPSSYAVVLERFGTARYYMPLSNVNIALFFFWLPVKYSSTTL